MGCLGGGGACRAGGAAWGAGCSAGAACASCRLAWGWAGAACDEEARASAAGACVSAFRAGSCAGALRVRDAELSAAPAEWPWVERLTFALSAADLFTVRWADRDPLANRVFVTVRDPVREFVSIRTGVWPEDLAPCRTEAVAGDRSLARRALAARALADGDPVLVVLVAFSFELRTFIAARSRAGATTPMCPV